MNNLIFSLGMGWVADLLIGDPEKLPHPVVWFGKMISFAERAAPEGTAMHTSNMGNGRV